MKKQFLALTLILLSVITTKAQLASGKYSDYFKEGSFLLIEENYDQALKNFTEAYKLDSSSANINFNMGYCLLYSSVDKKSAERYFSRAVTNVKKNYRQDDPSEKGAPPLAHFFYGRALHLNYKFDEAAAQYDIFDKEYAKDKVNKENVTFYRAQTTYAKELVGSPINVSVTNLGDSINSEFPDYSPSLSADERTIIFTTRRNTTVGGERAPNGLFYEDIVIAYKDENDVWSKPKSISPNINTSGNDASINLTPDGQTLITYQDIGKGGDIFFSTWDGNDWSFLQQFGSDVNTKYWETHACLSADLNTLYFVSDRPGGFGGRDIYRCVKLPNGKWSLAQNLGPKINTKYDEDGPFIHPDGITLFFSSNGHKTMGGFDIFFATIEGDKQFTEPINMGYPVNTPDDDVFFVVSPDGKRAYFSSAKDGGFGEKDIYIMEIKDAKEKSLALFKGSILPADGEKLPDDLMIIVTDKETGDIVGTYKPKQNGTFSTILPPNKNYNFSYQSKGEEFYNEDLFVSNDVTYQEIKKEINLEPVALLGKVKVKSKQVLLSLLVLNNPISKEPVANAKVFLTEKGGATTDILVDDKGKKDGLDLAFDKVYTIYAEANGKKSEIGTFNTNGIKGSKSINQIIYFEGKPAAANDLALNLVVLDKKRKPLANSKVTITGDDGSKYEGTTDEKGRLKNAELSNAVNYEVIAENNGSYSDKIYIAATNAKTKKSVDKTIIVSDNSSVANNNSNSNNNSKVVPCGSPISYKKQFGYNQNVIEESQDWENLINSIVAKTKDCNPTVKIASSASQVPTRAFSSNRELAKVRAEKMEEKIKSAVTAKGGDANKIIFTKGWAVRGPEYATDYQNTEKYCKYQYVRVIAK